MRLSLHRWLAWRPKRRRIPPRIAVAIVFGATLLIVLVNWLGYAVPTHKLALLNTESLEHFSRFQKIGYRKPPYYLDLVDGEAWDMYARAVAGVESMDKDERRFIVQEFMKKTSHDSARARYILAKCDSVIAYLSLGTRRKRCTIPLDYEDGMMLELPNFMAIRGAANLMACRARLSVQRNPRAATDDVIDGVVFSQDLAGGGLSLIGHMIGIACLDYFMDEIHHFLKHFYLGRPQLERLAAVMDILANTWPLLTPDIEGEHRVAAIYFGKPWSLRTKELEIPGEEEVIPFYKRCFDRLNSYDHDKYTRRAIVSAAHFQGPMIDHLTRAETEGWGAVDSTVAYWMDKLDNSRNTYLRVSIPNIQRMYERRFEGITRARLAGVGALVEMHVLKHGHWPQSLEEAATEGLEELFTDPMTGEPLKYHIYPEGDSVAVYSVGTNMRDDGGIMDEDKEDLVLILHQPKRSR